MRRLLRLDSTAYQIPNFLNDKLRLKVRPAPPQVPAPGEPLKPTQMKKMFCSIFGHHFAVSKRVTSHINEYSCIHCGKQVTTDVSGNLSQLTPQLREINKTLEYIYQKKHTHHHQQQVA